MNSVYALFHLNLAFSSIAVEERPQVVEKCYWPLLDLIENKKLPLGIELTAWTLRQIQEISPDWVARFKQFLKEERCELIGSGYTQMIGPLAPYEVNCWNQRYGLEGYQALLGVKPKLALVNEMAYSSGMLSVYRNAGYQGIIMDRDNICLAHDLNPDSDTPACYAVNEQGTVSMPVLWSHSILFQKLQRYVHGDIRLQEYLEYFGKCHRQARSPLSLYCNDAEVFDHRPGRFGTESNVHAQGEWQRLAGLIDSVIDAYPVKLELPSTALNSYLNKGACDSLCLTSVSQPIPVKKQSKYNISRWAVTGRDDLWLNTMCHRIYQKLKEQGSTDEQRKQLCELWASDLRTHITVPRWREAQKRLEQNLTELALDADFGGGVAEVFCPKDKQESCADFQLIPESEGIFLDLIAPKVKVRLNLRRGLALDSLAFASQQWQPLVGTLQQGYFDSIALGADFYSGITVIEKVAQHARVTDLERVQPKIEYDADYIYLSASIRTADGDINKYVKVSRHQEEISCGVGFPAGKRPYGIVRTGYITVFPDAFQGPLRVLTQNGGDEVETFELNREAVHGRPGSSLVSASTGFGGSGGSIILADREKGLQVDWDPSQCAAFPMLHHQKCAPGSLTRILFSLSELDESFREGGRLPGFHFFIQPYKQDND